MLGTIVRDTAVLNESCATKKKRRQRERERERGRRATSFNRRSRRRRRPTFAVRFNGFFQRVCIRTRVAARECGQSSSYLIFPGTPAARVCSAPLWAQITYATEITSTRIFGAPPPHKSHFPPPIPSSSSPPPPPSNSIKFLLSLSTIIFFLPINISS